MDFLNLDSIQDGMFTNALHLSTKQVACNYLWSQMTYIHGALRHVLVQRVRAVRKRTVWLCHRAVDIFIRRCILYHWTSHPYSV
jgi:hypothetical protein